MSSKKVLKRVLRFVKPYKARFIISVIAMSAVSALTALMYYLIKPVINNIFTNNKSVNIAYLRLDMPKEQMLFLLAAVIIIIALVKGLFQYIARYYMAYIGQSVTKDIRNRIFRHLMFLSLSFYTKNPTGQLMSRITNDVRYLERSVVKIPIKLIKDGLQFIFLMVLIFYLNYKWASWSIIGFMVIVLPFSKFSRMLRKISRKGHQQMADIYDFLAERISGISLIKAFSMEKSEERNMRDVNNKYIDLILKSEKINAFQGPFIEFLSYLGTAGIVVLGGLAVINDATTPGDFFTFLAALSGMYMPAKNFANLNQQLQRAIAASERIFQIIDYKEHILQSPNPLVLTSLKESINFINVGFSYEKEQPVLENIDFQIDRGEIVAFVGASGAGKTTLVNLVPRFYDVTEGAISIDGVDIRDYNLKSLRRKVAIVMQDVILFNTTIKENICYGLGDFNEDEIIEYAKAANAHHFICELPDKYNTIVGERGVKLSGGQKQRISIARALIKNPEILILDEATSHLDTESEKLVQDAMDNLIKGRTTLVIAHRLSTIRKADKIVVLDHGRIIEFGCHEELLAVNGLYRKMFELQSE